MILDRDQRDSVDRVHGVLLSCVLVVACPTYQARVLFHVLYECCQLDVLDLSIHFSEAEM